MEFLRKDRVITIISYLFILLFIYAAVSKILEFKNFQAQLGQSPLLSAFTGFISYAVLTVEIIIAIALSIPKVRLFGLYAAFLIMVMFTAYIVVILNYSSFIPCSCGGILEKMEWKGHLFFNIGFCILAVFGIIDSSSYCQGKQNVKQKAPSGSNSQKGLLKHLLSLAILTVVGTATIVTLYISSENKLHKENPFIRRFIQGAASRTAETKLHNNTLYFAGSNQDKIYIGDYMAPLHVFEYDTTLKTKKHFKIKLDSDNHPFQRVQLRIAGSYFFLMDGTVPVIYRGKISDWKATTIKSNNTPYFSTAEIIDSVTIAFRSRQNQTGANVLGRYNFNHRGRVTHAPSLLQKQIDGYFDTDGMMHFDQESKKMIYTYYYRNQFIVTDDKLLLLYRGKTIDTTSRAKIKVAYIKDLDQRKLASSSGPVNSLSTHNGNLLLINSTLRGRFETIEMWKRAAIVDVYNIRNNTYLSSIYIYNIKKENLHDMILINKELFVIIGQTLQRYSLSKHFNIEKKFTGR
jgi:uncharacterized membrane protein YphA (DoxX/SURF4 family)